MTREQQLSLIYRHTHRDYKGKLNGARSILVNVNGATELWPLSALTDAQIADKLPYAMRKEVERLDRKRGAFTAADYKFLESAS